MHWTPVIATPRTFKGAGSVRNIFSSDAIVIFMCCDIILLHSGCLHVALNLLPFKIEVVIFFELLINYMLC